MMNFALVCGAGGFIGGHLVKRLKRDGFWVRGVDIKFHEFSETEADDFMSATCGTKVSVARSSIAALMRSISLQPIWGARVTSLPANTMPT